MLIIFCKFYGSLSCVHKCVYLFQCDSARMRTGGQSAVERSIEPVNTIPSFPKIITVSRTKFRTSSS